MGLLAGPGSSKLGIRTTAAIIFGRLVLVPPTGLGIVMLADKLGLLPPGDKMFRFVLLLQHTMPTSVLSGNTRISMLSDVFAKHGQAEPNLVCYVHTLFAFTLRSLHLHEHSVSHWVLVHSFST